MRLAAVAITVLFAISGLVHSQDAGPTTEVIASVKRATVFIPVQGSDWKGSGSGFVVKVDKETVYVATNYHVLAGPSAERKTRPGDAARLARANNIKVVFGSGTKDERTLKADPIALDPDADLAVLKVTGVTDPPAPISLAASPKLFETMPIYSFGFPFGKALGVGAASPAVTVGKATISSLRLGEGGELSVIQIDGNLNPGNSGGPIVDVKGQLVGVAVAKIRDGQGIGFAVPAADMSRVLSGGLTRPHLSVSAGLVGTVVVKVEVGVIDPDGVIREIALDFVTVAPKAAKPGRGESLQKFAGAKRVTIKVEGGVATGDFVVDKPSGEFLVQATPLGRDGKGMTAIHSLDLSGAAALAGGAPPVGWKEFVAKDNSYAIWIPDRAMRHSESDRTAQVRGLNLRSVSLRVEMAGGVTYTVDQITLPPELARNLKQAELEDAFRDWVASDFDGKVVEESEVQLGTVTGREYRIAARGRVGQVRLFLSIGRVLVLQVTGPEAAMNQEGARTFLNSCRLSPPVVRKEAAIPPRPRPNPIVPPTPTVRVAPQIVKKVKLPPTADRDRAAKLARDLFKEEFALTDAAAKASFASKLYQQGTETNDDPASQFVLFREAAAMAAAADIELALRACDAIVERFEGSTAAVLEPIFEIVATNVTSPEACGEFATIVMRRVDEALVADEIEAAARLHKIADQCAQRSKNVKLARQSQTQASEIESLKASMEKVRAAMTNLMTNPNDADACLVVGKHKCFLKGDWKQGLPMLAKSSDAKLKEIATKDLEAMDDDRAAVAVADEWYQVIGEIKDYPKTQIQLHVHSLYSRALPVLMGLTKTKIEKRLDELDKELQGKFEYAALWPLVRAAVRNRSYDKTQIMGGDWGDKDYTDIPADGGILIGFNYTYGLWAGTDLYIDAFQPIYLTPSGERLGEVHGDLKKGKMMTLKAKPNYAIGKMAIPAGCGLWAGTNVVYMRIDGKGLKASDSYESGWIGQTNRQNSPFLGDGRPIIGIYGKKQRGEVGICSIGLYVVGEKPEERRR